MQPGIKMSTSQLRTNVNSKMKAVEAALENKSLAVFQSLCKINDNENSIDLNFLRNLMALYDSNANLTEPVKKIITRYGFVDAIKGGKISGGNYHSCVFNSEEFVKFLSGKNVKQLLFDNLDNLPQKRFSTEEYVKVINNMKCSYMN